MLSPRCLRCRPLYAHTHLRLIRPPALLPRLYSSKDDSGKHTIENLLNSFRDPSSPYYLAPGATGPASPEGETLEEETQVYPAEEVGKAYALKQGFDPGSFWEQTIAWGDLDSFRHLNNVRYVRFFESGRMRFAQALGEEVGGLKMARDMMEARGISIILKSIDVKFKRPVTYPDTLLIAHKPHALTATQFTLSCLAYSYAQQAPVATAEAVCVWYDYDVWKKAEPSQAMAEALQRKAR